MHRETSTFQFLFDILQKYGPAVVLGGLVLLAVGFLRDRPELMIAGAVVAVIGVADIVIRVLGLRSEE